MPVAANLRQRRSGRHEHQGGLGHRRGQILVADSRPTLSHEGPRRRAASGSPRWSRTCAAEPECRVAGLGMAAAGLIDFAGGRDPVLSQLSRQVARRAGRATSRPAARLPGVPAQRRAHRDAGRIALRPRRGRRRRWPSSPWARASAAAWRSTAGCGSGPLGAAGELGHQIILPDGPRCGCGNRGCLETLASGPAIVAEGVRLMHTGWPRSSTSWSAATPVASRPRRWPTPPQAGDADRGRGDRPRGATTWASRAVNVVVTLHPDLIVLGGGVAQMGESCSREPVERTIRQRVGMFPTDGVAVKLSQLGDQAGVLGGIALAAGRLRA